MPMFQIPGVRWCAEVPEVPVRELRLSGRFHRCSARLFRFDFTVENAGTQPVRVPRLPLLRLAEPCLPFPFERCVVTRLARQKNDVPGPFHPARVDAALRNAAFDSSEIIAGGGVAWCEMEEKETLPHSFHCDPGLALSDEAGTFHCFIGFDGQTRHLSDLVVESDEARSRLVAVTAIAEGDREAQAQYPDLIGFVKDAVELTKILQRKRKAKGGVALDVKEAKIIYENGVISIPDYERTISHEMIEQFMVLANESVATVMTEKGMPFVYRVHERPSPEKAEDFLTFLREAGVHAKFDPSKVSPADYQELLQSLEQSPLYSLVNRVMLASECYCHFTSPIRRYPDLCIHRIIKESFLSPEKTREKYKKFVVEAAAKSSACEKNAAEAERDVDALYTVAYMQDKVGEIYEATISGVTSFGFFAELASTVEGLVPIETLPEDSY